MNSNNYYFLNPYVVVWEITEDNYRDDPNPSYYDSAISSSTSSINIASSANPSSNSSGTTTSGTTPTRVRRSASSNSLTAMTTTVQNQIASSSIVNGKYAIWNRQIKRLCINNQQFQASELSTLQVVKGKLQKALSNKPKPTSGSTQDPSPSSNINLYIPIINQYKVDFYTSNDSRIKDSHSRHWSAWYKNPYFHLFIVQVDDLEIYKNHVKPKLRKWVDYMTEREYEYLICYVSTTNSSSDLFKKFSLFSKVYDKLKSDFAKPISTTTANPNQVIGGSRVIKLGLQHALSGNNNNNKPSSQDDTIISSGSNGAVVKEMYQRIHEGILLEFSRRCAKYEEEIKKTEQNMHLPGWQFSQYFIQKEGLSFLLEQFGLYVNSLGIYNQIMGFAASERKKIQYTCFVDSSKLKITNILEDNYEQFRESMKSSQIMEFDFQNYVFSRQMHLYFKLHSPDQVARLSMSYIGSMIKRLEQELLESSQTTNQEEVKWNDSTLSNYLYIHSWAYSAAFCVAEECSKRVKEVSDEAQRILYRLCGDIYLNARHELQLLGGVFKLKFLWEGLSTGGNINFDLSLKHIDSAVDLNTDFPTVSSLEYAKLACSDRIDMDSKVTLIDFQATYLPASMLKRIITTQDEFDERFLELTSLVAETYGNGLRNRFYQKLNGEIAAIHFRQKRYQDAFKYLKGQLSMYLSDGWSGIATDVLIKMAECTKQMKSNNEYVASCVDLISSKYTTTDQKTYYWKEMLDTLKETTDIVPKQAEDGSIFYTCQTNTKKNEAYLEMGKPLNLTLNIVNDSMIDGFETQKLILSFVQVDEESYHDRLIISRDITNTPIKKGSNVFVIEELMLRLGTFRLEKIILRVGDKLDLIVPPKPKDEELQYNRPFVVTSQEKERKKSKSENTGTKSQKSSHNDVTDLDNQMDQFMDDDQSSSFTTTTMASLKRDSLKEAFLLLVLESKPTLTIETLKEQLFLLNSVHYFSITIDTKQDLVDSGFMSITSLSEKLRVCPDKKGFMTVDDQPEQEIDILDCSISIPKLGTSRRITYRIPILATEVNKTRTFELYSMNFKANYTKQVTRETFKLQKTFEINFFQPFSTKCYTTRIDESRYMLQLVAKCITPKPLDIIRYSVTTHTEGFRVNNDFNTPLLDQNKVMELFFEDAASFVFEVDVAPGFASKPPTMTIDFTIPTQDTDVYTFTVPNLAIEEEVMPQFFIDVCCSTDSKNNIYSPIMEGTSDDLTTTKQPLIVGRSCVMSIDVTSSLMDYNQDQILILDISINPEHWVISGPNRIVLDAGFIRHSSEISLVPLSGGYVELPTIDIIRKTKQNNGTMSDESLKSLIKCNYHDVENEGRVFVLPLSSKDVIFGPLFPVNFPNVNLSFTSGISGVITPTAEAEPFSPSKSRMPRNPITPKNSYPSSQDDIDNGTQWNEGPLGKQAEDMNAMTETFEPSLIIAPNIVDIEDRSDSPVPPVMRSIAVPISKIATPPPHMVPSKVPGSPRPTPRTAVLNMRKRAGSHKRTKSEFLAFSNAEVETQAQTDVPVANPHHTPHRLEVPQTDFENPTSDNERSEGGDDDDLASAMSM